jgi:hypothetical protein
VIAEAAGRRPKIVLPGWRLASEGEDGQAWAHVDGLRSLIWSVARELDGRLWLHVSVGHRDRLPRWSELVEAKEWIAGGDSYAYQVIPPRSRYVNQNPNVLHVWSPLEGESPLPDFTRGGDTL